MSKTRPILELYEENATHWEAHRSKHKLVEIKYLKPVLDLLSSGDEILDIGCGSGVPIAQYFIENGMKITGIDGAEAMIQIAKKNFPGSKWLVSDMRQLKLNHRYSVLIAWDSFFHLTHEEQEKMFPIFKEHLKPGGILIFTSGTSKGIAIGDLFGSELFHSSLSTDEYRNLLAVNGFEVVRYQAEDPECAGHTVWVCKLSES